MTITSESPRQLAEGIYWLTDCLVMQHEGETIHSYSSAYLVHGDERSLLVDTGHPKDWPSIEAQLDRLEEIGVPPIEYIFPTHAEVPHAANLGRILNKYPEMVAVGDLRDYHLFFPEFTDRFEQRGKGDSIALGGTEFLLLDAVIKDLVTSLWAYDTRSQTLFPGDGFAYMHHHQAGECWRTAEEVPDLPIPAFTALFNSYALYWTRFNDIEPHIAALDRLLAEYPTSVIAPGHGSPILDPAGTLPRVKEGLRLGSDFVLSHSASDAA
ncbi:MAG: MBL fold metallo-hydrolase [Gaiellaceae bacterium]